MIYYFYTTSDPTKEAIYSYKANDLTQALEYFTTLKAMSMEDFLTIYSIGIKNESK
jgi:hypothetical protein